MEIDTQVLGTGPASPAQGVLPSPLPQATQMGRFQLQCPVWIKGPSLLWTLPPPVTLQRVS